MTEEVNITVRVIVEHVGGGRSSGSSVPTQLLRYWRESSGLTQQELADKLAWVQSKISKIEDGKQGMSLAEIEQWKDACRDAAMAASI